LANALARNSVFNAVAGLSFTFGGFFSNVIVARLLGVEGTGAVAFAAWIVTVAVMLSDLGVPGALARYTPELQARGQPDEAERAIRFLFRPFIAAVLVLGLGFLLYAAWLTFTQASAVERPASGGRAGTASSQPAYWALIGVSCLVQGLASFTNGCLKGRQEFRRLAGIALVSAAVQITATFLGGYLFGIVGAMAGAVAGAIAPALLVPRLLLRSAAGLPAPELRSRMTGFAWETWAGYLVGAFVWARMEVFFLELSWGSVAVGLFSVSLTLAALASQGPLLLSGGLLPYLSQHSVGDGQAKSREAYAVGTRLLAFLIVPACLGAAAIAPALIPALYGPDFAAAVPTAMILVAATAVQAPSAVASTYMLASRERGSSWASRASPLSPRS
jgi:O-antigen/teichoic acid export membrane protein